MLEKLIKQLPDSVMRKDFFRLRQQLFLAKRYPEKLEKTLAKIETASQKFQKRLKSKPNVTLAEGLPVSARVEEIVNTIQENQIVVVAGETGSGKTTQLPKMCLLAGLGEKGLIACTQPRRIAARSMAEWGFRLLSIFWLITTIYALYYAIKGNIALHQIWIYRSIAFTSAAITLRILLGLGLGFLQWPFLTVYVPTAWLCWLINIIFVELFIYRKKPKVHKKLNYA